MDCLLHHDPWDAADLLHPIGADASADVGYTSASAVPAATGEISDASGSVDFFGCRTRLDEFG
jgi:hypothetical protein